MSESDSEEEVFVGRLNKAEILKVMSLENKNDRKPPGCLITLSKGNFAGIYDRKSGKDKQDVIVTTVKGVNDTKEHDASLRKSPSVEHNAMEECISGVFETPKFVSSCHIELATQESSVQSHDCPALSLQGVSGSERSFKESTDRLQQHNTSNIINGSELNNACIKSSLFFPQQSENITLPNQVTNDCESSGFNKRSSEDFTENGQCLDYFMGGGDSNDITNVQVCKTVSVSSTTEEQTTTIEDDQSSRTVQMAEESVIRQQRSNLTVLYPSSDNVSANRNLLSISPPSDFGELDDSHCSTSVYTRKIISEVSDITYKMSDISLHINAADIKVTNRENSVANKQPGEGLNLSLDNSFFEVESSKLPQFFVPDVTQTNDAQCSINVTDSHINSSEYVLSESPVLFNSGSSDDSIDVSSSSDECVLDNTLEIMEKLLNDDSTPKHTKLKEEVNTDKVKSAHPSASSVPILALRKLRTPTNKIVGTHASALSYTTPRKICLKTSPLYKNGALGKVSCQKRSKKSLKGNISPLEKETLKKKNVFPVKSLVREYINTTQPQLFSSVRTFKKLNSSDKTKEKSIKKNGAQLRKENEQPLLPVVSYTPTASANMDLRPIPEKSTKKVAVQLSPTIIKHAGRTLLKAKKFDGAEQQNPEVSVLLTTCAARSHTLKIQQKKD